MINVNAKKTYAVVSESTLNITGFLILNIKSVIKFKFTPHMVFCYLVSVINSKIYYVLQCIIFFAVYSYIGAYNPPSQFTWMLPWQSNLLIIISLQT